MQELTLISRARSYGNRVAIRCEGKDFTYQDLLAASSAVAASLLYGSVDLKEARVAFQAPAGFSYFAIQWGIWRAGGVAVPLSVSATRTELEHALVDSEASHVIVIERSFVHFESLTRNEHLRLIVFEEINPGSICPFLEINPSRRAMILYTSGTTNKPKGVVTTHANIQAQIEMLVNAWEWNSGDSIPLFLPMHHIHGIINIGSCALWSGAFVEAFPKFEMETILDRVAAGAYSVFMAVPTIYVKLIEALQSATLANDLRDKIIGGFSAMRLMISGSAALPASVHETWTALTGQRLLERYGMTETGMMISNPYHGERRPGSVGQPFPVVEIRLKSETGEIVTGDSQPGEIQARGPVIFCEYWNAPDLTAGAFDGGWFLTGDVAVLERGYYRIMGRLSVDIIKSGGYKLSALEIEAALLEHPSIRECAVVGIKDDTWGEMVAVAAVLAEGAESLDIVELQTWSKNRLSHYKMPRKLVVVDSLPRNAMGKVTKKEVAATLAAHLAS